MYLQTDCRQDQKVFTGDKVYFMYLDICMTK